MDQPEAPDMEPMADEMDPMMDDMQMEDVMDEEQKKEDDTESQKTSLTEQDLEQKLMDSKPMNFDWWFMTNIIMIAIFAGLLQGYQVGLVAGTELFLGDEYRGIKKGERDPTTQEREFFVSVYSLGAAIGAFVASQLADCIGRKWTVFIGAIQILIGFILILLSGGILGGIFGRFVAGLGQGINGFALMVWLIEVGMQKNTKITMAIFNIANAIGMILGLNLAIPFRHHWKWLYIAGLFPVLLLLIFMLFMPESPIYLLDEDRDDEVLEVLKRVCEDKDAITQLEKLKFERRFYFSRKITWANKCYDLFVIYGWPFGIVIILTALGQLVGTSAFLYYGPEIISMTESDVEGIPEKKESADILDNFIVISFIVGNLVSAILITMFGRKPITLTAIPFALGAAVALSVVMYEYSYGDQDEPNLEIKEDYKHFDRQLFFGFVVVYVLAIAIGLSSTVWQIACEIIPNYLLAHVTGISQSFGWLINFAINSVFLNILQDPQGRWILFAVLGFFALVAFLFLWLAIPETNGLTTIQNLENIIGKEQLRERRKKVQGRGGEFDLTNKKEIDQIKSEHLREELLNAQNNYKASQTY